MLDVAKTSATRGDLQRNIGVMAVGLIAVLLGMFVLDWWKPTLYSSAAIADCVDRELKDVTDTDRVLAECSSPSVTGETTVSLSFGDLHRLVQADAQGLNGASSAYLENGAYLALAVTVAALVAVLVWPSAAGGAGLAVIACLVWLGATVVDLGSKDWSAVQPGSYVTAAGYLWLVGALFFLREKDVSPVSMSQP
jgi:hypothetical protein